MYQTERHGIHIQIDIHIYIYIHRQRDSQMVGWIDGGI